MVFVVAELGVNWHNIDDIETMCTKAQQAGANAVKFQVFRKEHIKHHPDYIRKELETKILTPKSLETIKTITECESIEFFATPFFTEAINWLEDLGVKRYKIRLADHRNTELIHKAIKTEKPVYISFPPDHMFNIPIPNNVKPTYCIPEYPPSLSDIALKRIFNKSYKTYVGYSNHYPTILPPLYAAICGAEYIEVHVKIDNSCIDSRCSLTFEQLELLIDCINEFDMLGDHDNQ